MLLFLKLPSHHPRFLNLTEGFYINDVQADMGAAKSGIKKGDVIVSLDNIQIVKFSDLSGYLSTKRPGDNISVGIIRDYNKINLNGIICIFDLSNSLFIQKFSGFIQTVALAYRHFPNYNVGDKINCR